MNNLLSFLQAHTADILSDIETLVRIETPSHFAEGLNRLQDVTQTWLSELGTVTRHVNPLGDVLHARVTGQSTERVLLLAHVVSYALVHSVLKSFKITQGFSISGDFVTIWVLCLIVLLFMAFVAAFLNSFLVLLFLEIIARKKDPEAEKTAVGRLITSEASSWHGSSLKI